MGERMTINVSYTNSRMPLPSFLFLKPVQRIIPIIKWYFSVTMCLAFFPDVDSLSLHLFFVPAKFLWSPAMQYFISSFMGILNRDFNSINGIDFVLHRRYPASVNSSKFICLWSINCLPLPLCFEYNSQDEETILYTDEFGLLFSLWYFLTFIPF